MMGENRNKGNSRKEKKTAAGELGFALAKTLPILCSYLFLSMAFGIMMNQAGFAFYWAYLISLTIYTGAFQFVMVSFLTAGTGLMTVVLTALAMNSRHLFYGISYVEKFRRMGKRYPYMIFSLTDETYALYSSLECPEELREEQVMFHIAWLSRVYWLVGTLLGAMLGEIIPFDLTGIDFCMTALFLTILIDQWKKSSDHLPAVTGAISALGCLFLFGADRFMLPALLIATGILFLKGDRNESE